MPHYSFTSRTKNVFFQAVDAAGNYTGDRMQVGRLLACAYNVDYYAIQQVAASLRETILASADPMAKDGAGTLRKASAFIPAKKRLVGAHENGAHEFDGCWVTVEMAFDLHFHGTQLAFAKLIGELTGTDFDGRALSNQVAALKRKYDGFRIEEGIDLKLSNGRELWVCREGAKEYAAMAIV